MEIVGKIFKRQKAVDAILMYNHKSQNKIECLIYQYILKFFLYINFYINSKFRLNN